MGIKGLNQLIKRFAPNATKIISLKGYQDQGTSVAIDTSIYLYRYMYGNKSENGFLYSFLTQAANFMKHGIVPIYVFDGKPPDSKRLTIEKRKKVHTKIREDISSISKKIDCLRIDITRGVHTVPPTPVNSDQDCNDSAPDENGTADILAGVNSHFLSVNDPLIAVKKKQSEINELTQKLESLNKRNIRVTSENIEDLKSMLTLMGVPYIEADGEAEQLCCLMSRNGLVDVVLSQDSDTLPFQSNLTWREVPKNVREKRGKNVYEEYNLERILKDMELSYTQFLDMCIMCGTDHIERVPRLGPVSAYRQIVDKKSIEDIVYQCSYKFPENYMSQVEESRIGFKSEEMALPEPETLERKPINKYQLKRFIMKKCGKNPNRMLNGVKNIETMPGSSSPPTQQKVTRFFKAKPTVSEPTTASEPITASDTDSDDVSDRPISP